MGWTREKLAAKAIFYDEDIPSRDTSAAQWPPHVEALRESMLDFSHPVLGHNHTVDEGGGLHFDLGNRKSDPVLAAAYRIQNRANSYYQSGYSEKIWEGFWETQFFSPLVSSTLVSKENSRRVSRSNYYYDASRVDGDSLWNLFRNDTESSFETGKSPKPDYVFYLPMYHLQTGSSKPMVEEPAARQWHQRPNPSLVEPFSWSVLKELFAEGLQPTPFRVFHKEALEANLKCYPWLIVEYKKEGVSKGKLTVSCQAANAAACALQLNENAATYAVNLADDAHVPPVPTITTIGCHAKVWIAHLARGFSPPLYESKQTEATGKKCRKGYIMRAIWEGDMRRLKDIVEFQLILENTHTWAMRIFKPLVSSYIGQWRNAHRKPAIDPDVAKATLLRQQQAMERNQTVMPTMQAFLDNISNIDIDDSKHSNVTPLLMGLLVQQIFTSERQVLTEELGRIVSEKIEAITLKSESVPVETGQDSASEVDYIGKDELLHLLTQVDFDFPDIDDPNDSDY
ncbi:hypothetical protein B0T10DRAFT_596911, partial [Thelonectria olida]